MGKAAIYAEEARRLFVVQGMSLDAVAGILGNKVSRRSLQTWKTEGQWDDKRREYIAQTKDTKEQLKNIVDLTLRNAEADPTPKTLLALLRAIQAFESFGGIRPQFDETDTEPKKTPKNQYSPEVIQAIRDMYGLKS
ncbi:MAG: hypothetical protein HGA78_01220 [Nitrospirales bacterium]|nr:hypothetical protein [Nitrospirales bacterium]